MESPKAADRSKSVIKATLILTKDMECMEVTELSMKMVHQE